MENWDTMDEANEAISKQQESNKQFRESMDVEVAEAPPIEEKEMSKERKNLFQYSVDGKHYAPCGETTGKLPAGIYRIHRANDGSWFFDIENVDTYDLIEFSDSVSEDIISEFESFWKRKKEYDLRNEPHKRGYLLCGPPGSGKTCIVRLMMEQFVADGNIVFLLTHVPIDGIKAFKEVEPKRKMMLVIEDVDALLKYEDDEQALLQLLDGGIQHSNTVIITTTNYPEKLPDRIINRPSRIDRVVEIDMPTRKMREKYIEKKALHIKKEDLNKWLDDTINFSFAHVKELIMSVEVYNLEYDEALIRIDSMRKKQIKSSLWQHKLDGKEEKKTGFGN